MNRADLFVYIALVVAWLVIAGWAYRIGRRANRLQEAVDEASESSGSRRAAL